MSGRVPTVPLISPFLPTSCQMFQHDTMLPRVATPGRPGLVHAAAGAAREVGRVAQQQTTGTASGIAELDLDYAIHLCCIPLDSIHY